MSAMVSVEQARAILGFDVLGPSEVKQAFGASGVVPPIPFTRDDLAAAAAAGEMLVWRVAQAADTSLTILEMVRRFPEAFDQKLLRQMGYELKEEWGIEREPLAARDTCAPGWALARKDVLKESRNRSYEEQDETIRERAAVLRVPVTALRRRSAVEAVYDTVLYLVARNARLLEKTWDWTSSRTNDSGYINVGGFGASGMQILSFSRAIRHDGLGVCPTRQSGRRER
jgi:hypothetical protein